MSCRRSCAGAADAPSANVRSACGSTTDIAENAGERRAAENCVEGLRTPDKSSSPSFSSAIPAPPRSPRRQLSISGFRRNAATKKSPPDLPGGYTAEVDSAEMVGGMHRRTDGCSLGLGTAAGKWSLRGVSGLSMRSPREPSCSIWSRQQAEGTGASGDVVPVVASLCVESFHRIARCRSLSCWRRSRIRTRTGSTRFT